MSEDLIICETVDCAKINFTPIENDRLIKFGRKCLSRLFRFNINYYIFELTFIEINLHHMQAVLIAVVNVKSVHGTNFLNN